MNSDILKSKGSNLNMGCGSRDKPERQSARAGFVDADSTSFGVGGKMRQMSARRMRCPNKYANGNHLGLNDPHLPAPDGHKSFEG
jgi:hypothetical protein